MNVLISMCKGFEKDDVAKAIQESKFTPTKIVIGGARAYEGWVVNYANEHALDATVMTSNSSSVPLRMVRNIEQLNVAHAIIVFWEGTPNQVQEHLIGCAREKGIPFYIYTHDEEADDE